MKTLKKMSLPLQGFGLMAVLLLLTQSAFAGGTDEDTDINNMATVNYDVGGVGQERKLSLRDAGPVTTAYNPARQ